jgi:hypothetical protein
MEGESTRLRTQHKRLTVEHDPAYPKITLYYLTDVASLFLQLTNRTLLRRFIGINQAGGNFNHDSIDRGSPLPLENDGSRRGRVGRVLKNRDNAYAINVGADGPGKTLRRFPRPRY